MPKKSQNETLTMEAVADVLSSTDKVSFFNVFWKTWSANGFGTLGKKDTELLVFLCLKKALGDKALSKQYDWARFLRLTPARVRSIQLEAHLRFGHLIDEANIAPETLLRQFFSRLHSVDLGDFATKGGVDSVSVSFVVEDPVIQMEIDRRVKIVGGYINFLRNRDVVVLRLLDFFRLVSLDEKHDLIDTWVRKKAVELDEADGLKKRVSAQGFANMTGAQQLSAFVDDLAETAKIGSLVARLKTIVAADKERKR
ncbi:MAG: hypothetical protein R3E35_01795 [Rhodocyclaceae bacterium]